MLLKELLKDIPVLECTADQEDEITAICYDSRKAEPGCLFVAVSGFAADGNRFIPMALERGAAAVVTAKKPEGEVPYILVESDRLALALLACNFYGNPARQMTMVGITGTNGKTSSTLLLKQVLEKVQGAKVGLVGTMANMIGQEIIPTERTTPESLDLQALFARMRDAGCTHVIMEVSSHALTLERVGGVHYDVAAFTNLTEDHLDFHKTMDAYCDAKAELFRRCGKAVINMDDDYSDRILAAAACPVLTTSVKQAKGRSAAPGRADCPRGQSGAAIPWRLAGGGDRGDARFYRHEPPTGKRCRGKAGAVHSGNGKRWDFPHRYRRGAKSAERHAGSRRNHRYTYLYRHRASGLTGAGRNAYAAERITQGYSRSGMHRGPGRRNHRHLL